MKLPSLRRHPEHDVGEREVGEQLPVGDQQVQPLDVRLGRSPVGDHQIGEGGHAFQASLRAADLPPTRGVAGSRCGSESLERPACGWRARRATAARHRRSVRPPSSAASNAAGSHGTSTGSDDPAEPRRASARSAPAGSGRSRWSAPCSRRSSRDPGSAVSSSSACARRYRVSPIGSAAPTATTWSARAQRRDRRGVAARGGDVARELFVLLEARMRCRARARRPSRGRRRSPRRPARAVSSGQRLGRPSPVSTQKPECPDRCHSAMRSNSALVRPPVPARRQAAAKPGASSSRPSAGSIDAAWVSASASATDSSGVGEFGRDRDRQTRAAGSAGRTPDRDHRSARRGRERSAGRTGRRCRRRRRVPTSRRGRGGIRDQRLPGRLAVQSIDDAERPGEAAAARAPAATTTRRTPADRTLATRRALRYCGSRADERGLGSRRGATRAASSSAPEQRDARPRGRSGRPRRPAAARARTAPRGRTPSPGVQRDAGGHHRQCVAVRDGLQQSGDPRSRNEHLDRWPSPAARCRRTRPPARRSRRRVQHGRRPERADDPTSASRSPLRATTRYRRSRRRRPTR